MGETVEGEVITGLTNATDSGLDVGTKVPFVVGVTIVVWLGGNIKVVLGLTEGPGTTGVTTLVPVEVPLVVVAVVVLVVFTIVVYVVIV